MNNSSLENIAISKELSEIYSFLSMPKVRQISNGIINRNYLVDEDYVLTIFRHRSVSHLTSISNILERNHSGLLPTPIISSLGTAVNTIDNTPSILFNKIQGRHFRQEGTRKKNALPNIESYRSVAKSFWTLHESLSTVPNPNCGVIDYRSLSHLFNEKSQPLPRLPVFMQRGFILDFIATRNVPLMYPSLIHCDMERQNILHDENGLVTGVVDVDALLEGDILYEYAHCVMDFVLTDPEYTEKKLDIFMECAEESHLIKSQDLKFLPLLSSSFSAKVLMFMFLHEIDTKELEAMVNTYDLGIKRIQAYLPGNPPDLLPKFSPDLNRVLHSL